MGNCIESYRARNASQVVAGYPAMMTLNVGNLIRSSPSPRDFLFISLFLRSGDAMPRRPAPR
jgi:hypothetical protein